MADRRHVRNQSGAESWVDIDRDMDEATFDRMVESGELTPVESKPKSAAKRPSSDKK